MSEVLIPVINAFIIHDGEGDRLYAKYYDGRTKAQQTEFEALLQKKSKSISTKNEAEILLLEPEVVVFKGNECKFFVIGSSDENELILTAVLESIYEAIATLLRGAVDKRTMLDNLELILLAIDEVLDHGHIMELDSASIVNRVLMRGADGGEYGGSGGSENSRVGSGGSRSGRGGFDSGSSSSGNNAATVGDLSLSQAFGLARDQFFKTLAGGSRSEGY
jgi:hypothetical protein